MFHCQLFPSSQTRKFLVVSFHNTRPKPHWFIIHKADLVFFNPSNILEKTSSTPYHSKYAVMRNLCAHSEYNLPPPHSHNNCLLLVKSNRSTIKKRPRIFIILRQNRLISIHQSIRLHNKSKILPFTFLIVLK